MKHASNSALKQLTVDFVGQTSKNFCHSIVEELASTLAQTLNEHEVIASKTSKEIARNNLGSKINCALQQKFSETAQRHGNAVVIKNNKSSNHSIPTIVTKSCIVACVVIKTQNWSKAQYLKQLAEVNQYLAPIEQDLFHDDENQHDKSKTLFLLVVNYFKNIIDVGIRIPSADDIQHSHWNISLQNAIELYDESTRTAPIVNNNQRIKYKKPKLKKSISNE